MEKFQVKGKKTDKVKSLSKGNQQKVQLIATLIHEPKLIILDEPFSGLDPVNAELLKDGIIELKEHGSCVIFSSHNMDNVEKICDHLIMLRNGKMVLSGKSMKSEILLTYKAILRIWLVPAGSCNDRRSRKSRHS